MRTHRIPIQIKPNLIEDYVAIVRPTSTRYQLRINTEHPMPENTILFIVPNRLYIYNECCLLPLLHSVRFIHSLNQLMGVCVCLRISLSMKTKISVCATAAHSEWLDLCHTQCNMHQFVVTTDANMYNSGNGVLRYIDGCEVNFPDDLLSVLSPHNANEKVFRKASKRYTSLLQSNLLAVHAHTDTYRVTRTVQRIGKLPSIQLLLLCFPFFSGTCFFSVRLQLHSHTFQMWLFRNLPRNGMTMTTKTLNARATGQRQSGNFFRCLDKWESL